MDLDLNKIIEAIESNEEVIKLINKETEKQEMANTKASINEMLEKLRILKDSISSILVGDYEYRELILKTINQHIDKLYLLLEEDQYTPDDLKFLKTELPAYIEEQEKREEDYKIYSKTLDSIDTSLKKLKNLQKSKFTGEGERANLESYINNLEGMKRNLLATPEEIENNLMTMKYNLLAKLPISEEIKRKLLFAPEKVKHDLLAKLPIHEGIKYNLLATPEQIKYNLLVQLSTPLYSDYLEKDIPNYINKSIGQIETTNASELKEYKEKIDIMLKKLEKLVGNSLTTSKDLDDIESHIYSLKKMQTMSLIELSTNENLKLLDETLPKFIKSEKLSRKLIRDSSEETYRILKNKEQNELGQKVIDAIKNSFNNDNNNNDHISIKNKTFKLSSKRNIEKPSNPIIIIKSKKDTKVIEKDIFEAIKKQVDDKKFNYTLRQVIKKMEWTDNTKLAIKSKINSNRNNEYIVKTIKEKDLDNKNVIRRMINHFKRRSEKSNMKGR